MIAARFRSVYLVAFVSIAGVTSYLATQHVAQTRAELAKVERDIHRTRIAIRELETELGTRGNMAQIDRWNSETLALAAPKPSQFLDGTLQLASLNQTPLPQGKAALPAPVAAAPAIVAVAAPQTQPPVLREEPPLLRQATYLRPAEDRVAPKARKVSLLDDRALAEIGRLASAERSSNARR